VRKRFCFAPFCIALLIPGALGQTFEVNGQSRSGGSASQQASSSHSSAIGWGASIEVARQARAAQDALKRGDYVAATNFATQAANAAPQNSELWFLLGYCARLAGRYSVSVDAYQKGLQAQPKSISGLAGLAQTYAKMGDTERARQLLGRIVDSGTKDPNSLGLAGELLLDSDPGRALEVLRRAEGLQPSAHNELLIARAYQRLNQPADAERFLERAKQRAPHDSDVLRAVAGQYRESGNFEQAISILQNLPGKTVDSQAELAYTLQLAGKKRQAAALYEKLARSAKENLGLQLSAAQALLDEGQAEAAQEFLRQARNLNANSYRLHAILAHLAQSEDQLPQAVQEYQLALQNLPANPAEGPLYSVQLRLDLYDLYLQQGNQSAARQQLDAARTQIQQIQPAGSSRAEFLRLRAAIESASGNTGAATQDLKQALSLAPSDVNAILNYAGLLWKVGQKDEARKMFLRAADLDRHNRSALTSLGFLAREVGDTKGAEQYFTRAIAADPRNFAPYLALADLYSAERNFHAAQVNYQKAYDLMPHHARIVAGATNAALEAHDLDLAKRWLDRADDAMNQSPQVMRERQRYLTWTGKYQEAANLGSKVLEQLPRDPEAPVYLAYDLYYLGRYQDAFDLAQKYESILPNNRDLALIAGYVHVRFGQLQDAEEDFTRAIERDPTMATGYANRGYVRNDLRHADQAVKDFQMALRLRPDYPEAHLGLAYADVQLHHPQPALQQLEQSRKSLGQTRTWHLARGEAFRQEQRFSEAEPEYRAALAESPDDLTTQLTLADVLYRMRRYHDSIQTLNSAAKLSPSDPGLYALMAQNYAGLGDRDQTLHFVDMAESYGKGKVDVLMATGEALLTLGERDAAMKRFSHALEATNGDRVGVRLAIAQIFVREGRWDDAQRQIALGFAEARVGDAPPVTAEDFVEAANIFLAMHDFPLAESYFDKARRSGADERVVAIGMANTYLAEGDPQKAMFELARLGGPDKNKDDYDYMMAMANLYRERQDTVHALSAFAQAGSLAGQNSNQSVQTAQYELAGEEGRQITHNLSLFSEGSFVPTLEDITVYTLDAKLLGVTNPALLPTPRHSFQSVGEEHYRIHLQGLPAIEGFAGESMTTGRLSFPSSSVIQDRNTYDTMFNGGISPQLHWGSNTFSFHTGVQYTVRRDTISPFFMNQNLFRQYLYLSTSSLFNWLTINGAALREAGPFTEQNLHSRDALGNLEFTVGRPWGSTSLLTGYYVRDLLFRPAVREDFESSTYIGLQHKFGKRLTVAALGEYLRSWRVVGSQFAIAQAMAPGARFDFRPSSRWEVQGSFVLSRGEGYHAYDNAHTQFLVSYLRPVRRRLEGGGETVLYPSRFSFGLEQQTFYNFTGRSSTTLLPIVRFTLF
jgi:tetratricopeptide (TPR) repeat protein